MTPSADNRSRRAAPASGQGQQRRAKLRIFQGVEPTRNDIIGAMAKQRTVERLVENITQRPLDALTADLAQAVYVYLLEFPEDKLQALDRDGELVYFTCRIIWNQWFGSRSTFRAQLRGFSLRSVPLDGPDIPEGRR